MLSYFAHKPGKVLPSLPQMASLVTEWLAFWLVFWLKLRLAFFRRIARNGHGGKRR
jgi:hypothetical protein